MCQDKRYWQVTEYVCHPLRGSLQQVEGHWQHRVQEIRLRAGLPVVLVTNEGSCFVSVRGTLTHEQTPDSLFCSYECLEQTYRAVCGYSVHTHQGETVQGYLSLKGGHRAGLGATAVIREGKVQSVKEISSLNLRVARQVLGCADDLLQYAQKGGLLLAGRPGSGKTTLLRDLARSLSGDNGCLGEKITLIDSRGELAGMWDGQPQNNIGLNTDVLNGFDKATATEMAVRSLSPDVLICDEIGCRREADALLGCLQVGVRILGGVHAGSKDELLRKEWMRPLLKTGVFAHVVFLKNHQQPGKAEYIIETEALYREMDGNCYDCGGAEYMGNCQSAREQA